MIDSKRLLKSEYMRWAKTSSNAKYNLATSGFRNLKLNELDLAFDQLGLTTEDGYGYPPLLDALAKRLNVKSESIVTAAGTTFANHLAMAALISPGDEVLIEQPTYEPLLALAHYLGARVKRFGRRFENGFQVDAHELRRAINSNTRLIVLTNLHNPTGVLTSQETLTEIGKAAASVNAVVHVDEVYLETLFEERPRTAFHLGPEFVTTSSLTKAYGLSGLRCGWIVATPGLAKKMWLLNDLFSATPVHMGERMSVLALGQLERISKEVKRVIETNRKMVYQFLDTQSKLEAVRPEFGTTVFPRLQSGSADRFCDLLRERFEVSVVPGRFFEMPQHFRLGLGGDTETLKAGLDKIGKLLKDEG